MRHEQVVGIKSRSTATCCTSAYTLSDIIVELSLTAATFREGLGITSLLYSAGIGLLWFLDASLEISVW